MVAQTDFRKLLLEGRHRLSLGRVHDVIAQVQAQPRLTAKLVELLWDDDSGVVNRAAQAVELLSRQHAEIFQPWKSELIGLLTESEEKKLRWSLAAALPRLRLSPAECLRSAEILNGFLEDSSSVVKTCALQGLYNLAQQEESLQAEVGELLRIYSRSGTPAMRARSRILLKNQGQRNAL